MNLVCFDNGGTLVDDPFEEVLDLLSEDLLKIFKKEIPRFDRTDLDEFIMYWKEENYKIDFPFASHFLQEEVWINNALLRLTKDFKSIPSGRIPYLSLKILEKYRIFAKKNIQAQIQLPKIIEVLDGLKELNSLICVASNDREFATLAMMEWTQINEHVNYIFTSEGLSKKYDDAEKPSMVFFNAMINEIGIEGHQIDNLIYVGDSEKNDIEPLLETKFITIRFINLKNPQNAKWLDTSKKTLADYYYTDIKQLLPILRKITQK